MWLCWCLALGCQSSCVPIPSTSALPSSCLSPMSTTSPLSMALPHPPLSLLQASRAGPVRGNHTAECMDASPDEWSSAPPGSPPVAPSLGRSTPLPLPATVLLNSPPRYLPHVAILSFPFPKRNKLRALSA